MRHQIRNLYVLLQTIKEHFKIYRLCYLSLIFILLLVIRRPDQFTHPFIWAEDGTLILPGYIESGWFSLFTPVNGYLVFTSKIINFISFELSFLYYPIIASFLTNLFIIFVLLAIIQSPTVLKNRALIALSVILIPTDSEVFGVALYSVWWAGLLGVLSCLWHRENKMYFVRILFSFLSFSSSPFSILFIPILIIRCFLYKNIREYFIAIFSVALGIIQLSFILGNPTVIKLVGSNAVSVSYFVNTYFGLYLFDHINTEIFYVSIFLICFILYLVFSKKSFENITILYLLFFSMLITYLRLGEIFFSTHPYGDGPRYYFYPYIMINIMLINNLNFRNFYIKHVTVFHRFDLKYLGLKDSIIVIFLILSISHSIGKLTRTHDYMSWQESVKNCMEADGDYEFPVFTDGNVENNWSVKLTSDDCKRLVK